MSVLLGVARDPVTFTGEIPRDLHSTFYGIMICSFYLERGSVGALSHLFLPAGA